MKLNDNERALAIVGGLVLFAAVSLSAATEIMTRRHLAEHKQLHAAVIQQGTPSRYAYHIAYEEETLKTRWAVPGGHATLGVTFAALGMILIAVPRATARKRRDA